LPFQTHEWAESWWAHYRRDDFGLRDELRVHVLRDRLGGLRGVVPLMRSERPGRGPLRLISLQLLGADPNLTEIRRALVAQDDEAPVWQRLVAHLDQRGEAWDWVVLGGLRRETPEAHAWLAGRGRWSAGTPAYVLALPPTWEQLRARLRRNIRESLRKCYNSLSRGRHDFRLHVAESAGEVDAALPLFFDLHRRRAAVPARVRHPDLFAAPTARRFLRDVCARLGARGAVRVFALHVSGAPVAARVGFVLDGRLYLYYSGYDPAWAGYSVMTTTLAEALRWAIDAGLRSAHLSTGRDVSKTRWDPQEIVYGDVTLVHGSARARLAHQGFTRAFAARHHPLVRAVAGRLLRRAGPR
jgi:CelD/BcsL family acetyltransferase involved in cellulose biosynthesis